MRTRGDVRRGRGKASAGVLAALGCLLVVGALALLVLDRGARTPYSRATPQSRPQAGAAVDGRSTPARKAARHHRPGTAARVAPDAGRPVRVVLPALAVSAPVVPVRLEGAALVPPSDPSTVGWWSSGAVPGAARGTAVIAGHTVHTGGGAFDALADLNRGDRVRLVTRSGVVEYAVTAVRTLSKADLATQAASVFSQSVPGRLALVTCDDWNGTAYESNDVVLARPLRRR